MMFAVSYASGPSSSRILLSMWHEPDARISTGSQPDEVAGHVEVVDGHVLENAAAAFHIFERRRAGSLEHNFTVMTYADLATDTILRLTLAKVRIKSPCKAVISLMPALSQMRMASMVSGRSVAIGFSQNTSLPAAAHFVICSAWK